MMVILGHQFTFIQIMVLLMVCTGIVLETTLLMSCLLAYLEDRKLSHMSELERYEYLINKYGFHWQEHL